MSLVSVYAKIFTGQAAKLQSTFLLFRLFSALFCAFYYFNMNLSIVCLFVILKPLSERATFVWPVSLCTMHSFVLLPFDVLSASGTGVFYVSTTVKKTTTTLTLET